MLLVQTISKSPSALRGLVVAHRVALPASSNLYLNRDKSTPLDITVPVSRLTVPFSLLNETELVIFPSALIAVHREDGRI